MPATMVSPAAAQVATGLEDVVVCESAITHIDGPASQLAFRGYQVADFAEHADYLAVVYLLWHARWPDRDALAAFDGQVRRRRALPPEVHALVERAAANQPTNPMAVIRTAVSLLGMLDAGAEATDPEAVLEMAAGLLARLPTLVAALGRFRHGLAPIAPDPELGHAANYLYMLRGARPSAVEAAALNTLLTLHCEHELNASTFTARTVAGTLSDYYSALTAAMGAIKGRRHGGAIDQVPGLLRAIGSPDAVPAYVERTLAERRRLPGFGHRVYRARDPRASLQAAIARRLEAGLLPIAACLEDEMLARKGLPANVDYYAAVALEQLGFEPALMTSFIASARVAGWTAHVLEQLAANRLIRPRALYRGPRDLTY